MKPKPLVALNHFTVPMLTGVVPSQEDIVVTHFSGGLVRSNFWKGRQRLNRLYRWIANVVRPKIDWCILCEAGIQNNPEVHDFLIDPCFAGATVCHLIDPLMSCPVARRCVASKPGSACIRAGLPPFGSTRFVAANRWPGCAKTL